MTMRGGGGGEKVVVRQGCETVGVVSGVVSGIVGLWDCKMVGL
jgi:hypothetical protein